MFGHEKCETMMIITRATRAQRKAVEVNVAWGSWASLYGRSWISAKSCWMHRIFIKNDVDTEERL